MKNLTEDDMRRALFGSHSGDRSDSGERTLARSRLRVTLRVSNEYEGKMFEYVHDADTLSTLLAEQQATKAARKKYRFIELVSVRPL